MDKRRTPEQILRLLRDADRDLAKGLTVADFCRKCGITETSYYRWRQRFDAAKIDDARRLRELQAEIERLKLLAAELLLDKRMLQEAAQKKVVTAVQQRAAANYLCDTYKVSQRRAARVLGRARSTLRYRPAERSRQASLAKAIQRLARKHPRWGYRFIHALLLRQGWQVNLKCVHRLWQELKLQRPLRRRKAKKLGCKPGTSANSCVKRPARFKDDVWTCDFVADRIVSGSPLTWLTQVDEYSRECLALYVAASVSGAAVRRVLARVIGRRGAPQSIRSDNGSEFICEALRQWLPQQGPESLPVAPGSPWENGYSESFNSRFRDEFVEAEEFENVLDAREKGACFRREYNTLRPHSSLGDKTPKEFSNQCEKRRKKGKTKDERRI